MVALDEAIQHLKEHSDLIVIASTTWKESDFRTYEDATGLKIPEQL